MLKCTKEISAWDEGLAQRIEEEVKAAILEAAGVDESTWNKAYSIVAFNGYFGPVETDEEDMSVGQAEKIVHKAVRKVSFSDYEYLNPEYPFELCCEWCGSCNLSVPEDGPNYCRECEHYTNDPKECNNCILESKTIKAEVFKTYYDIYGH